ncbi:conjugative transfer protein MobI(A/C) [Candidatus Thiodictyon syntrophicum]|jgi:hypothetical protein|uniref:Uncharacterized protein n=1 Tax=Candidatus Thiodictyon syntrophicum TaxID=1166950 RepID=A0A2K8UI37_9GAMM|nr:conjugative transfer protein MobI(A/C) [Candidatus Thiodictyon syntrophicum]AUB85197.1 hypothetical protein THSYN_30230 [Candidatus Thiodictyon syntrophicum]
MSDTNVPAAMRAAGQGDESGTATESGLAGAGALIDRLVEESLGALAQDAHAAIERFQARLTDVGRDHPKSEWGKLGVRVRAQHSPQSTPGAFAVEWVSFTFAHGRAGRRCHTTYIPRGTGDRYQRAAFRAQARPWQIDLIMEAEETLGRIRAAARQLSQARVQLRSAARAVQAARACPAG